MACSPSIEAGREFIGKVFTFYHGYEPPKDTDWSKLSATAYHQKWQEPRYAEKLAAVREGIRKTINHQLKHQSDTELITRAQHAMNDILQVERFWKLLILLVINTQTSTTSAWRMWKAAIEKKIQSETDSEERQKLNLSLIELQERLHKYVKVEHLQNDALGLYFEEIPYNHSCEANALQCFDGDAKLRIIATRDIAAREEVTIDYVRDAQLHLDWSKYTREELKKIRTDVFPAFCFFTCACRVCRTGK
jgi:hypothetical protein